MDVVSDDNRSSLLPRSKTRSRRSYIPVVGLDQIGYSLPIALLAFLSTIKYLEFFTTVIFMTIYRVTYPRAFFIYLTGNLLYDDVIVIALGCAACATIFHKNKRLIIYSIGIMVTPLAVTVAIDNLLPLDITALISFPGILVAYYVFRHKKQLDLGRRITRNSLIMTGTGILFVIELLSLITWIIYPSYAPFWSKIFSPAPEWYLPSVEAQLFYAGARLAPAIALILSFSFLIRPGFNSIMHVLTGKSVNATAEQQNLPDVAVAVDNDKAKTDDNKAIPSVMMDSQQNRPASDNIWVGINNRAFDVEATTENSKEEKQKQAIDSLTADDTKRLHPNIIARRKLNMKIPANNNPALANRALEKKNKEESHLNALVASKTASKARLTSRSWVFISITLVILFSLYPYIPTINKDFATASVDSKYYINQIDNIKNNGLFSKDGPFSFSSERALSVLFFYGLATLLPGVQTNVFVAYLPIFLGSFLVFSGYLLIRYGRNTASKNESTGREATAEDKATYFLLPLLVPFSMQFIVGIYGGFFSNMLALSFMLLTFLFYLRFLNSSKMLDLGLFFAMMFMTLFSHVYTWVFLIAALVISTAIILATKRKAEKKKAHIIVLGSVVTTAVILLVVSSFVITTNKSGVSYLGDLLSTSFGQDFFGTRWFNLNTTFRFYLGGFLANTVLLGLALIWAFKADYKNHFNAVMLASIFIFSAFFFLGDEITQSRIFYNVPLFIPAAIVLSNFITGKYLTSLDSRTRTLVVIVIFLTLGNYALRSLANFYLIVPTPIS